MIVRELFTILGFKSDSSGAKQYEDTFNRIKGFALKAASTLGITLGIKELGGEVLKLAGNYEQTQISLTALTGSADRAKKLFAEMTELAENSPFSRDDLLQYSKQLIAIGYSADQTVPFMRQLSDIAAGVGKEAMPAIVDSLARIRMTGRADLRSLMEIGKSGVPIFDQLAKSLHLSNIQVREMAGKGAISSSMVQNALSALTGQGGQFYGLANRQANTLFGTWKKIKETFESVGTALGTYVLPLLEKGLKSLESFLSKNKEGIIKGLERGLGNATWLLGFVYEAVRWVLKQFDPIGKALDHLMGAKPGEGWKDFLGFIAKLTAPEVTGIFDTIALRIEEIGDIIRMVNEFLSTGHISQETWEKVKKDIGGNLIKFGQKIGVVQPPSAPGETQKSLPEASRDRMQSGANRLLASVGQAQSETPIGSPPSSPSILDRARLAASQSTVAKTTTISVSGTNINVPTPPPGMTKEDWKKFVEDHISHGLERVIMQSAYALR